VNVTELGVVVRVHPSGVEIVNPPGFEVYGTKAMVSGMSPGGLSSVGTGDSEAGGLGDPPLELAGPDPPFETAGLDPPPHAESTIVATRAIGAMDRTGLRMGTSFGQCRASVVRARS